MPGLDEVDFSFCAIEGPEGAVQDVQRSVMQGGTIKPHLAKPRPPRPNVSPRQEAVRADVGLKCESGPGTEADRNRWAVRTGKTARGRAFEFGRNQCLRGF